MSDHSTVATTDLTSQYVAQVANDLERNAKEQERVGAEIAELQQQLEALRRDHALLVKMQQALDLAAGPPADAVSAAEGASSAEAVGDSAVAESASVSEPSEDESAEPAEETAGSGRATVPAPRGRGAVKSEAEKPKRKKVSAGGAGQSAASAKSGGATKEGGSTKAVGAAKTAGAAKAGSTAKANGGSKPAGSAKATGARSARKPATPKPAGKASAVKAPAKAAESAQGDTPKLVDLVRRHLDEQKEPRSAAEVATALGQAHPERTIKVTVIRSTLEGLVARNQAQRGKQGTSVFYTAPDNGVPAPERAADAPS
ncbi:hypothetical protein ACFU0X_09815 [Streptomyces cellulosae]|uniref:Regulatory protein n=1 Tax=Streptomyces cellulosae TaxID=1968 RepID=A0ABW6JF36_STRCE